MEQPLISVIVPVYNVEGYVQPCLDALLAQTWPKLELILIDDASTDGSGDVCEACAARVEVFINTLRRFRPGRFFLLFPVHHFLARYLRRSRATATIITRP